MVRGARLCVSLLFQVSFFYFSLPSSGEAASYVFTKIADNNTVAGQFLLDANCPGVSLNNSGAVAFAVAGEGIFAGNGVSLTTVADTNGSFSDFGPGPAINDAGTVAFLASKKSGVSGIFAGSGGTVTTIADSSSGLNAFLPPAINYQGTVVFRAFVGPGDSGGVWFFTGSGGQLTPIVSNQGGPVYELRPIAAISAAGTVAFTAGVFAGNIGTQEIFTGNGGPLVAVEQTIYSNLSSPFTGLGGCLAINASKTIAFEGDLKTGGGGIFTTDGGSTTPVIVNGPLVPYPWPSLNDAGTVGVLAVHLPGGSVGIFTGPNPVADKVIETGDILFGAVVQQLAFFRGLNNNGQVAFLARLADGTIGIYRADPVVLVGIAIKPGSFLPTINPKSRGKIPVAILSSADFNAPVRVNVSSVTFGRTGNEMSLSSCNSNAEDVNGDGLPDLVCHFSTELTGFRSGDIEGILKGKTVEGTPIIGQDSIRIVPF